MKQKLSRVLFIKTENASVSNTPAQRRRRILPECAFRKRFEKREKPDGAVPPVGFENGTTLLAPESRGDRRRRSTVRQGDQRLPPGSGCRSASGGGRGGRRRALCRRWPLLRRTAVRTRMELAGGAANVQIDEGVRVQGVEEGCRRSLDAGDGLTAVNAAGARGGRRWPESRKKGSSRPLQWPGGVYVRCRGGVCSRGS